MKRYISESEKAALHEVGKTRFYVNVRDHESHVTPLLEDIQNAGASILSFKTQSKVDGIVFYVLEVDTSNLDDDAAESLRLTASWRGTILNIIDYHRMPPEAPVRLNDFPSFDDLLNKAGALPCLLDRDYLFYVTKSIFAEHVFKVVQDHHDTSLVAIKAFEDSKGVKWSAMQIDVNAWSEQGLENLYKFLEAETHQEFEYLDAKGFYALDATDVDLETNEGFLAKWANPKAACAHCGVGAKNYIEGAPRDKSGKRDDASQAFLCEVPFDSSPV